MYLFYHGIQDTWEARQTNNHVPVDISALEAIDPVMPYTCGAAITLLNTAQGNTVRYCNLVTVNPTSGVVNFGSTTGNLGNNNNIVSNCNIHSDGTNFPGFGIYSAGRTTSTGAYNSNKINRTVRIIWARNKHPLSNFPSRVPYPLFCHVFITFLHHVIIITFGKPLPLQHEKIQQEGFSSHFGTDRGRLAVHSF